MQQKALTGIAFNYYIIKLQRVEVQKTCWFLIYKHKKKPRYQKQSFENKLGQVHLKLELDFTLISLHLVSLDLGWQNWVIQLCRFDKRDLIQYIWFFTFQIFCFVVFFFDNNAAFVLDLNFQTQFCRFCLVNLVW